MAVRKDPFPYPNSRCRWSTNSPVFCGTRWFIDFPANPVHPRILCRLRSILILSSRLRLDFPRGCFPSRFPTESCAQGCSWERCGRLGLQRPRGGKIHVLNENLVKRAHKNRTLSNQMKGNSVNNLIFQKLIISVRGGHFVSRSRRQ